MSKQPLYSIIIPVKGRLEFTKETIDSVYSQRNINLSDIEIIVIEESRPEEIIRHTIKDLYPKIKIVVNSSENSVGGNRNCGLIRATGKYIVFLDSDDKLKTDYLYKMSKVLSTDNTSAAVVCLSNAIFSPNYDTLKKVNLYLLMFIRDVILLLSYIFRNRSLFPTAFYLCQISHMVFRRDMIKNLGFKQQYRRGGEDWDFFVNVLKHGNIKIAPQRLLVFRYSRGSYTDKPINRLLKWQSYLRLSKNLPSHLKKGILYHLFLQYIRLFGR